MLVKSNYVPRILAVFGIFAYLVALIVTITVLSFPTLPAMLETIPFVPALFFEVIIGFWLLFRGAKIHEMKS